MAYFPMCVDLTDQKCVVVGGGNVAERKVRQLIEFGAAVTVVSPKLTAGLTELEQAGQLIWEKRPAGTGEDPASAGIALVVAATDDQPVNRAVSEWCRSRRIPVNVVDEKELCTFFFPAVAKDGEVVVSASTGGTSPALAARLRRQLLDGLLSGGGEAFGKTKEGRVSGERFAGYGHVAAAMGGWRDYVKEKVTSAAARKNVFERMLDAALRGEELTGQEVDDMIAAESAKTGGKAGEEAAPEEKAAEERAVRVSARIRIGTRGSRLALAQTELFVQRLKDAYPDIICETVVIKTTGDKIQNKPLSEFGGKAVFVTEFEEAIQNGVIDYAVHSAKDMPSELSDGLDIVCVLPRADVRDVLVTKAGRTIREPDAAVIGTGSLRRRAQFLERYPHALIRPLRGNITTRLEKLKNGEYDGIILAAAGLSRLGLLSDRELEYTYLDTAFMTPAGGQAFIAVEGKRGGQDLFAVTDRRAARELSAEREILKMLGAGCHEAVGVYARCSADDAFCAGRGDTANDASCTGEMTANDASCTGEVTANDVSRAGGGDSAAAEEEPCAAQMQISLMRERDGVIRRVGGSAPAEDWHALAKRLVQEITEG